MEGWLGAACLLLAGAGWGKQVAGQGVTLPTLLLTLVLSGAGLVLTAYAFMQGAQMPLVLGAVGAVAGAALMIFTHHDR